MGLGGGDIGTAAIAAVVTGYRSIIGRRTTSLSDSPSITSPFHMVHDGETSPLALSSKIVGGAVQVPALELDTDRKEVSAPVADSPPRLGFGSTPSLDEAKEAIKDLKEAMDGQILSSGSTALTASMPRHAVQAFSLLQGCPKVQSVVASLASDPSVWDAVLKNIEVVSFIRKQHSATLPNEEVVSTCGHECFESANSSGDDDTMKSSMFADMFQNIKAKVSAVVSDIGLTVSAVASNISDIMNIFVGPWTDSTQGNRGTENDKGFFGGSAPEAFHMALAIAVILVVMIKRGALPVNLWCILLPLLIKYIFKLFDRV